MAQPPARLGFALVTLPSKLGVSFTRYLLKNTSLPVVLTGGLEKFRSKEFVLKKLADIEGAASRVHYIYGDITNEKTSTYLQTYLRYNFQQQPLRLMLALQRHSTFIAEEFRFKGVTRESILAHYQRSVISHQMLMKELNGFLPKYKSKPFQVSETDKCKLPAHAIWAVSLGRSASISQNTAGVWHAHHAASAATLQLTKVFDNFLRLRNRERAISVAFHPGTTGTELKNQNYDNIAFHPGTTGTEFERPNLGIVNVLSEDEAAERIMKVLTTMPPDQGRGRCWDYNHEEIVP